MTAPTWSIEVGDVIDRLRTWPDRSVHCVVTSPPYWGLRDYGTGRWEGGSAECAHTRNNPREDKSHDTYLGTRGQQEYGAASATPYRERCGLCGAVRIDQQIGLEETPWQFIDRMVEVFREVRRVLRDDGTCWLNLGDCYANDGKFGGETGGMQAYLPDADRRRNGREKRRTGLKPKDLCMIPHRVAIALQDDGWWVRSDNVWAKPNPMPESVTDRTTRSHEYVFLLTKAEQYFYDAEAVREAAEPRAPWAAQSGKQGVTGKQQSTASERRYTGFNARYTAALAAGLGGGRNRRSVWTITTQPYPGAHFATFPEELPLTCILAGTSAGGCCPMCAAPLERIVEKGEPLAEQQEACGGDADGEYHGQATKAYEGSGAQNASDVKRRILEGMRERITIGWRPTCACAAEGEPQPCVVADPFNGSGTTGAVAIGNGRSYRGIDLNPAYVAMSRRRIGSVAPLIAREVAS